MRDMTKVSDAWMLLSNLFTPHDCRHPIQSQMKELKQVLKERALGVAMYQKFGEIHQRFVGNAQFHLIILIGMIIDIAF